MLWASAHAGGFILTLGALMPGVGPGILGGALSAMVLPQGELAKRYHQGATCIPKRRASGKARLAAYVKFQPKYLSPGNAQTLLRANHRYKTRRADL